MNGRRPEVLLSGICRKERITVPEAEELLRGLEAKGLGRDFADGFRRKELSREVVMRAKLPAGIAAEKLATVYELWVECDCALPKAAGAGAETPDTENAVIEVSLKEYRGKLDLLGDLKGRLEELEARKGEGENALRAAETEKEALRRELEEMAERLGDCERRLDEKGKESEEAIRCLTEKAEGLGRELSGARETVGILEAKLEEAEDAASRAEAILPEACRETYHAISGIEPGSAAAISAAGLYVAARGAAAVDLNTLRGYFTLFDGQLNAICKGKGEILDEIRQRVEEDVNRVSRESGRTYSVTWNLKGKDYDDKQMKATNQFGTTVTEVITATIQDGNKTVVRAQVRTE